MRAKDVIVNNRSVRAKGFIIPLIGGLGNQLFIYAGSLALKEMFHVPIFLLSHETTRVHSMKDCRQLMKYTTPIDDSDETVIYAKKFAFTNREDAYWNYDEAEIPLEEDNYILFDNPFFQKYEKIKGVIQTVKEVFLPQLEVIYPDTKTQAETSAFIHVRRGDYLTDLSGARMVPTEYYTKGLNRLNNKKGVETIYMISNDIAWCKGQAWDTQKKIVFYDDPDELKTLYLMSQCWAGAVISNSTFSLWGVFLGAYGKTDMIVYPKSKYFLNDLPDTWIVL